METPRPCLAEFLGTFYLCFAGVSAILCNTPSVGGNSGLLGTALARGLALSIAVNAFGGISGAHFNPAVTCGFLATGRIPAGLAGACIAAQPLGATTALSREPHETISSTASCASRGSSAAAPCWAARQYFARPVLY